MSTPLAPTSPRVWGRVNNDGTAFRKDSGKPYTWVPVAPQANGSQSNINLTWLCQVLSLIRGESPFFSTTGIDAQESVMTQIAPDSSVNDVQMQFSQYFAVLQISKVQGALQPTYSVYAVTFEGTIFQAEIPV